MTKDEFAYWTRILRVHFPDHDIQLEAPCTPEEVRARRVAKGLDPVFVRAMRDGRLGEVCYHPTVAKALVWSDNMTRQSDSLEILRIGGGQLIVKGSVNTGFFASCVDAGGRTTAGPKELARSELRRIIRAYMFGDVDGCVRALREL